MSIQGQYRRRVYDVSSPVFQRELSLWLLPMWLRLLIDEDVSDREYYH